MKYGAMWQIEPQLNKAGYTLGDKKELVEKLHFGLNICHIHRILTDGEYKKALDRFNSFVVKNAIQIKSPKEEA